MAEILCAFLAGITLTGATAPAPVALASALVVPKG
jgi:hypothetical protein